MKPFLIRTAAAALSLTLASLPALADVITYYHNDLLGSPRVATNASGQVVWTESYSPHGARLNGQVVSNKVWYTSRHQDDDTGLVYMGARYYDPVTGRFTGVDSKRFDESNLHSFNRYEYANGNPYRFKDPDGKTPILNESGPNSLEASLINERTIGTFQGASDAVSKVAEYWLTALAIAVSADTGGAGLAVRAPGIAERILAAERTGAGLSADLYHRAASFLTKEQLEAGRVFSLKGGDNVERMFLQTEGKVNDKAGVFEYIVDPNKGVTHQRFIEGGSITGRPNQVIPTID